MSAQAMEIAARGSLIEAAQGRGVQAELIPLQDWPDEFFATEEQGDKALYTAERFHKARPEDYARCVELLAGGMGLLRIARLLRVHHRTVAAVRDREPGALDIAKQSLRAHLRTAIALGAERLADEMGELATAQLPVATAILVDKLAALDGEPTQRVQVTHRVEVTHDALARELEAFPVEAEPVAAIGSGMGENTQKAPLQ